LKTYLDTSALAKWYLNEPESQAFCGWVTTQDDLHVSSLTLLEARCLLARRRRMGEIDAELEQEVFACIEQDIDAGVMTLQEVQDAHFRQARLLLEGLGGIPLRTLDAIHLALARACGCQQLASYDTVMLRAAEQLLLTCVRPV